MMKKWMHELEKCETPHFGCYTASCFPKCLMDYEESIVQPSGKKMRKLFEMNEDLLELFSLFSLVCVFSFIL